MTHPIAMLQALLVPALLADPDLVAALGGPNVFDAPSRGIGSPYVTILRHDLLPHDGDLTPGFEHRIVFEARHPDASRRQALAAIERIEAVASAVTGSSDLIVTSVFPVRIETAIDLKTGEARAALTLRILTEPAS